MYLGLALCSLEQLHIKQSLIDGLISETELLCRRFGFIRAVYIDERDAITPV